MPDKTQRLYSTHKCSRCGQKFTVPMWVEYTYKVGDKLQCSYHCYSETIDEYNLQRKKHR